MMIEGIPVADLSGPAILSVVALLAITDRLVWHTRLRRVERERDEWRDMALGLLTPISRLTVQAEVTNDVLTRLPDPGQEAETR